MKSMANTKNLLRSQLRIMRDTLTPTEVNKLSDAITSNTIGLINWQDIQTIHIYMPLHEGNEVDTTKLASWIQKHHPLIRIASWTAGQNPEPIWLDNGKNTGDEQFDLIIVPMLGFNDERHRLGFGGGFYDRFLKTQSKLTVGFCYEFGHVNFDSEAHDVAMNYIVTDKAVYKPIP